MVKYFVAALNRLQAEKGQALAEYSLILAFVFVASVFALGALGLAIATKLDSFTDYLPIG